MSEATRAWIYRVLVLLFLFYWVATRPETFQSLLPIILGLIGSGLATANTSIRNKN